MFASDPRASYEGTRAQVRGCPLALCGRALVVRLRCSPLIVGICRRLDKARGELLRRAHVLPPGLMDSIPRARPLGDHGMDDDKDRNAPFNNNGSN